MPAAGEDSGAHDPQPSALSVAPGCPFRGQRRWQTWPSVPRLTWGLQKSSNVLQGPLQMPNPALFSTMSLPGTRTPPAMGISPLERQLLYPDSMKGVCISGSGGEESSPPVPWGIHLALACPRAGAGAEAITYPAFLRGTALQGLPQGLCDGGRRASGKAPVQGVLLLAGATLEAELPAGKSAQLSTALLRVSGCQVPAGATPCFHRTPDQRSARRLWLRLCHKLLCRCGMGAASRQPSW